jgi:hypothetical protein
VNIRLVTAAAVLVSAGVHLYLWFDVFKHQSVIGPAFLLNVLGGLVIAALLVTWRHWLPALLAVGFGVSTLGAFVVASTIGLFGVHEHWVGWPVWTAAVCELIAILAGVALLTRDLPARSGRQFQHQQSARRADPH